MKTSQQLKVIGGNFELSNNKFFNAIAAAVAEKIGVDAGIRVQLVGRSNRRGSIEAVLVGEKLVADAGELDQLGKDVDVSMADMKNPSEFVGMLK